MEELTTIILSGIAWDAMKKGITISTNYLKGKLSNWFLDDEKLEEISECVQNIPEAYCISEGMVKEYLNLNERLLEILKETKQKNSNISQKIKGDNNITIGSIKDVETVSFSVNKNTDIDEKKLKIDEKNLEINERHLKILETDHNPYFVLEYKDVWEKVEETRGTDKIAKYRYTLINNGGNITNVHLWAESLILFYIPTGEENEWYIFKYRTHDFDMHYRNPHREEEKDRKFVFYEYTSEKDKNESDNKSMKLGKYLSKNLNKGITHSYRNVLHIEYTDYMGEQKRKMFKFSGSMLEELDKDIEGVSIGVGLDATISSPNKDIKGISVGVDFDAIARNLKGKIIRKPVDINDVEAVGKVLKKEIEDWLKQNKGKKGYKNAVHAFYNYDIIP